MFNISGFSPGFSKTTFCGSGHVPRDASSVADPGFSSGPAASVKQSGTKMPFFQVPSSGNDSVENAKLQNPLFQRTLKEDPHFETQVKALERMLTVRERVAAVSGVSGVTSGKSVGGPASGADGHPNLSGLRVHSKEKLVEDVGVDEPEVPEFDTSVGVRGSAEVVASCAGSTQLDDVVSRCAADVTAVSTAGDSKRIISLRQRYDSDFPSLDSSGCANAVACACWPAAASSSSFPASGCSSSAVSAVDAHARFTPMHDAHNSCSDTALNSLRVQRATSYNPEGVVAHNSRRKVRLNRTVGSRSVVQTVDMSPAPAAGTYRRSADKVHDQRQISRRSRAESSRGNPGPGTGPGGRSGFGGGVSGHAAAFMEIPCSLVMPPGRHQFAPQSLGWARVRGSGKSGVWVLKGDARTYNLPRDLDDVGVVWESRTGHETAWATPGHVCSCSYTYGHGPVLPQANPSVFTEAVNLWSRVASLLTPWCAKGRCLRE